jgi:hypothetical protein
MLSWNRRLGDDDNIGGTYMSNIPHRLNSDGVKVLYLIGNSKEYATRAKDLDHREREELLLSMWKKELGDKADIADGKLAFNKYEQLL